MHRTMKFVGKTLCETDGTNWPNLVPYAQCVLRIIPMKALGGRSPYEVVTGMRPKLPSSMLVRHPVQDMTVDEYAESLVEYLRDMNLRLRAQMQDAADAAEQDAEGPLSRELHVGDLVLRRRNDKQIRQAAGGAPARFTRSVDSDVYRVIRRAAGQGLAYYLANHADPSAELPFSQPVGRKHLIKLDMPELNRDPTRGPTRVEILVGADSGGE